MARFDLYRAGADLELVLDCQANALDFLDSRFVVPMLRRSTFINVFRRLNPVFSVEGIDYVMATQFAASVPRRDLGKRAGTLIEREWDISNALDMLVTGY